ncbi:MAG: STAS/SEC14 domain-containing protein [Planctomycetes bacterium]|nr:STAS/SEC14 domain-containing protein [Planctomycetota bacterium]
MAVRLNQEDIGKILEIHVSERLTKQDYEQFVPEVERLIKEHGTIRLLFDMHEFHGWSCGAMWADTKFAFRHFRDIERLAVVGEKKWQRGMATFCKPFTKAHVRYFDRGRIDEARAWLEEELVAMK